MEDFSSEEDNEKNSLLPEKSLIDDAELYENTISVCGFGRFQVILLLLCGWALASDSVEIQVVSFVLPSACDLNMTSAEKGWLNGIIFVGMMVGGYLFGGAADIKGRRFILLWSMTINGLFGLASAFASNFYIFLAFRFMSGVGVGAAMPILFSYYVEFMEKSRRGPMIALMASFWMIGNIITSAIAWLVIPHVELGGYINDLKFGSWRIFVAIGAFPSLSAALGLYFLPESPKYLQMNGRIEEAVGVFTRIYKTNFGASAEVPDAFREYSEAYEQSNVVLSYDARNDSYVRNPEMCTFSNCLASVCHTLTKVMTATKTMFQMPYTMTSCVLVLVWFTLSFGYYGLWMWFPEIFKRIQEGGSSCVGGDGSANITKPPEKCLDRVREETDIYLEAFLVALANLPGNIITILVINKVGRRELLAIAMVLSGITVFFFWLVTNHTEMIVMSCIFSGISVAGWNCLDAIAVENYPTHLRSTAFGFQTTIGRIAALAGNLVFGQLVDVHCSIPLLLVSALLTFGGLSAFKLPKSDQESLK